MTTKEQMDLITKELKQANEVLREALKANPNDTAAVEAYKAKMAEIKNQTLEIKNQNTNSNPDHSH